MTSRDDVRRELDRVVDRLNSMALPKAQAAAADCHRAAAAVMASTPGVPEGVELPTVGVTALGSQLAVVGADFLAAPTSATDDRLDSVHEVLANLRRTLP